MTHATDHVDPAEARKRAYREKQAEIYQQLQTLLEPGESLLGFTRGKIAGGFQGKLFIGIESFFVPDVNVGLTEKRLILQHLTRELDKPSRNQPHSFPLEEVIHLRFADADAFHEIDELGRLSIQLLDEQSCRLRLEGAGACEDAKELVGVFDSLVASRRHAPQSPTQRVCAECQKVIDQPVKFCPYCGVKLAQEEPVAEAPNTEEPNANSTETVTEVVVENVVEHSEEATSTQSLDIEVTVEVSEVVVDIPEVVVETTFSDETPQTTEPLQAEAPSLNPHEITSWDAYAQRVIATQNALHPEGGDTIV